MTTKIDKIYAESISGIDIGLVEEAQKLSDQEYGYTPCTEDFEEELEAFVQSTQEASEVVDDVADFMRQYGIGQDLSSDKWSKSAWFY